MQVRAVVQVADRQFEVTHLDLPERLGPGEALLRVEACGVCGTDYEQYVGAMHRHGVVDYPVVPGHEPVGVVERLHPDARRGLGVEEGDRVAVEPLVACGTCRACREDRRLLCARGTIYGFGTAAVGHGLTGGFAEYLVLRPGTVVHRIAASVPAEDAVLFNPLGGGFGWAVHDAGTRPGDSVLVLGAGQRGLACVLAAREAGAAEILMTGLAQDRDRFELARDFGATATIDVDRDDPVAVVEELTRGAGVDRVVDVTPFATEPVVAAIACVRPGGTVVLAGVKGMREIPGFVSDQVVHKAITIRGSKGAPSWAYAQAVRAIESGRYPLDRMHTHNLGLDEIDYGVRALGGEVAGERALHITIRPDR